MTGMFLNVLLFIIEIVVAELLFTFRLRKRKNFFFGSTESVLFTTREKPG